MRSWDQLTVLEQLAQTYSDAHKDAYGFRDRSDTSHWTEADYEREIEACSRVIDRELEDERVRCLEAQKGFEEDVASFMEMGASDRATAIRWWFEGMGAEPKWFINPRYHTQEIEHVAYGTLPIPLWRFILPEIIPDYNPYC